jgi:hypothetical protein
MSARWIFLPALGAAALHAPVLRFDLLTGLKRPIDGGRTWRGRRLLGDNKTWRGALVMSSGPLLATVALHRAEWYRSRLPADANPLLHGAILGASVVVGELPNSFLKRRPGSPRSRRSVARPSSTRWTCGPRTCATTGSRSARCSTRSADRTCRRPAG